MGNTERGRMPKPDPAKHERYVQVPIINVLLIRQQETQPLGCRAGKGGLFAGVEPTKRAAIEARFWSKVNKTSSCWLWTASTMDSYGHGQFVFRAGGPQRHVYAHRVAWELTRGIIPDGVVLCHSCDVAACVNPDHLFLGTQGDNLDDARAKGRIDTTQPRTRTLTYADRLAIYHAQPHRGIGVELAKHYGVTKACISVIRRGRFAGSPERLAQSRRPESQQSLGALDSINSPFERVPSVQLPICGEVR